jgi:hypothetical protein
MPIVGSFAGASARAYGLGAGVLIGDFESIQTITAGSAVASFEFTSIPATYSHLQIRGITRSSSTDNALDIQFNSDTTSIYTRHNLEGDGSSAISTNATSVAFSRLSVGALSTSGSNIFGSFVCDILDYRDTNKFKTIRTIGGFDNNGSGVVSLRSGVYRSTNAITSIKIFNNPGNNFAQYSSCALYGVKA